MKKGGLLKWAGILTLVLGGSGILLFLPPFAIWPLYPYTLWGHRILALLAVVPFLLVLGLHGAMRRRKMRHPLVYSGWGMGLGFVVTLASGAWMWTQADAPTWLWIVHMGTGLVTMALTLIHAWHRYGRKEAKEEEG